MSAVEFTYSSHIHKVTSFIIGYIRLFHTHSLVKQDCFIYVSHTFSCEA